ncbi:2OG-Fe(II) oxygenase [Candidatus Woesearchaeota archaeon]|nr:2OG-Fe(II) oxygenase [Candidatus Woesearchaeota archaeon]
MLNKYINKKYLSFESLKSKFIHAKPFSHLVLKDFFSKNFINNFLNELKKENFEHKESDLFSFMQTHDLSSSNNHIVIEFYQFLNSNEFKEYLQKITGISAFGKIDCSGFIYTSKDYLLPHDDKLGSRKIAYVLNLSRDFLKRDGGSLDFFSKNKTVKSIIPSFNTFIIFKVTIGKSYHQVNEVLIDKKRLSVAGWFNDK